MRTNERDKAGLETLRPLLEGGKERTNEKYLRFSNLLGELLAALLDSRPALLEPSAESLGVLLDLLLALAALFLLFSLLLRVLGLLFRVLFNVLLNGLVLGIRHF